MKPRTRYELTMNNSMDILHGPSQRGSFIAEVSYKTMVKQWFGRTLGISNDSNPEFVIKSLEQLLVHYKGLQCSLLSEMKEIKHTRENPQLVVAYNGRCNRTTVCRITGEPVIEIKDLWAEQQC